jgi:hypothetical protein
MVGWQCLNCGDGATGIIPAHTHVATSLVQMAVGGKLRGRYTGALGILLDTARSERDG